MHMRQEHFCETNPGGAAASVFGWAQRLVRRQLDTLSRLGSAALRVAERATQVVADAAGFAALDKAFRVHDRVVWALGLIDALEAKLANDLQRLERGEAPELVLQTKTPKDDKAAAAAPEKSEPLHGEKLKPKQAERLHRERLYGERFDRGPSDREFADILELPTDAIIALICRELGLSPDWPRLAAEAWKKQEADRPAQMPASSRLSSPWMGEGSGDEDGALPGKPPDG